MNRQDCWTYWDRMVELLTEPGGPDQRRELAAHLQACAACRAEWGALQQVVAAVREVPEPGVPAEFWEQLDRRLSREVAAQRRKARWVRGARATALVAWMLLAVLRGVPPAGMAPSSVVSPAVQALLPHVENLAQAWAAGLEVDR